MPPPLVEVTVTLIFAVSLSPGSGFRADTAYVPAVASVPVAVNFVEDTNVVVSCVPANNTCAPFTKLLPFTVTVYAPAANEVGDTLEIAGIGFSHVTVPVPVALASACAVAVIDTVFELGIVAGAVYTPPAVIVPAAEPPPATPFTAHVTP